MNDPAAKLGSLRASLRDLGAALGAPGEGTAQDREEPHERRLAGRVTETAVPAPGADRMPTRPL